MTVSDQSSTPMMRQYLETKRKHADKILLFRLGDFYEFFFDDAKTVAAELNLTLTSRHNDIPMCGIPHHAADTYISRLVKKGYKLAICDQVEDPKTAKTIVRREVTSVITPGTVTNTLMLDDRRNNYLFALDASAEEAAAAFCDVSTGDLFTASAPFRDRLRFFEDLLSRFPTREVLVRPALFADPAVGKLLAVLVPSGSVSEHSEYSFDVGLAEEKARKQYGTKSLKAFGLDASPAAAGAFGALLGYVEETQKQNLSSVKPPRTWSAGDAMSLDRATIRNLELVRNSQDGGDDATLLSVMDRTCTAAGGRLLFRRILQPLLDPDRIRKRLGRVRYFYDDSLARGKVRDILRGIADLERLCTRIVLKKAAPKETAALKRSLLASAELLEALKPSGHYGWFDSSPVVELVGKTLADDPSNDFEEGGVIRTGFDAVLDKYRASRSEGRQWIAELEEAERKRSGISSLKIRYNGVFGYYIEITKANLASAPSDYIRKQTLANAERFTCSKLQEYETVILEAAQKTSSLERELYDRLLDALKEHVELVQSVSNEVSRIDVEAGLAELGRERNYCEPEIREDTVLTIRDGRHPVVEALFTSESFVPNDLVMDESGGKNRLLIVTGPNMAGKSTYLRQNALIVLMAQAGSFVPAASAVIGVADKIFTRVGASDNLVRGESTFLVEMHETANILRNATERSFLIMDEIGRGTSTYDGLSIAWSIVEHIADNLRSRTLFATHYHEMTVLENTYPGVRNFNILVREAKDEIVFLRRIAEGPADRSYGIQVGKLAGLPESVVNRAKQILLDLEADNVRDVIVEQKKGKKAGASAVGAADQLFLFQPMEGRVSAEIRSVDENVLTPVEALNLIAQWKKLLQKK
jgi:DNA mismatch repair protein MutS